MSKIYLKVKIKSLAEEAKIIKLEERKALRNAKHCKKTQGLEDQVDIWKKTYSELKEHRKGIVRSEYRAALLAYGFIRGKTYNQMENNGPFTDCGSVNWSYNYDHKSIICRVGRLICKYGNLPVDQIYIDKNGNKLKPEYFEAWLKGGNAK